MAGDWIKMRVDLPNDPAVVRMSAVLGVDRFGVVGRLHAVWGWADAHADGRGRVTLVSHEWVDSLAQTPGFARVMESVGWLTVDADGVAFPRFERHMGGSAKARTLATERKRKSRRAKGCVDRPARDAACDKGVDGGHAPVTLVSQKGVTREEKRREEKKKDPPSPPQTGGTGAANGVLVPVVASPAKPARPRNPLFDAVADVTGADPVVSGSHVGKLAAVLSKAEPPYTADDVREFGRRFLEFCPWASGERDRPTIGEVQKNIGRIRAGPSAASPAPLTRRGGFMTQDERVMGDIYDATRG